MPETSGRSQQTRINPETAWTVVTDSPLRGMSLAREAGLVLAWDEGNQLYLLNLHGEMVSTSRAPGRVLAGAISDEGSLVALLIDAEGGGLLLLDADFQIQAERPASSEATQVAVNPHGRYVVVATRQNSLQFVSRYGRPVARIETIQSLAHIAFVADRGLLVGAAAFGLLMGFSIEGGKGAGRLEIDVVWQERLMSNVGRLAMSGDGSMILASCYTLGIQRFDLRGRNEGSYHLGGTVSHAVPDFPGRTIAAATLEGDLAIMNSAGNVRWRTHVSRPVIATRRRPARKLPDFWARHGRDHPPGHLWRRTRAEGGEAAREITEGGRIGNPSRLGVDQDGGLDGPRRGNGPAGRNRGDGCAERSSTDRLIYQPPQIKTLRPDRPQDRRCARHDGRRPDLAKRAGWIAAATDRQIVLCDLREDEYHQVDVSLVQLTHLAIRPADFGLGVVQERDRLGRLTIAGRWVWKRELRLPIEEMAIGPGGLMAVTTNAGELMVFDPAGEPSIAFRFDPTDARLIIEAPDGSPPEVAWITLARRSQFMRGHGPRGQVIWERPVPWEGWGLLRLGRLAVASSADGQAMTFDGAGTLRDQSGSSQDTGDFFSLDANGTPVRITRRGVHLICATFDGRVRWRAVVEPPVGPMAADKAGIAVLLGKSLAWFKNDVNETSSHIT